MRIESGAVDRGDFLGHVGALQRRFSAVWGRKFGILGAYIQVVTCMKTSSRGRVVCGNVNRGREPRRLRQEKGKAACATITASDWESAYELRYATDERRIASMRPIDDGPADEYKRICKD